MVVLLTRDDDAIADVEARGAATEENEATGVTSSVLGVLSFLILEASSWR